MQPPAPLTRQLIRKALALQESLDSSFAHPELSLARVTLLHHIMDEDLPLSTLADLMGCGRSNLTSLMDKLERQGWVERIPDKNDRRKTLARITTDGKAICIEGALHIDAWETRMLSALGTRQAAQLEFILEALTPED